MVCRRIETCHPSAVLLSAVLCAMIAVLFFVPPACGADGIWSNSPGITPPVDQSRSADASTAPSATSATAPSVLPSATSSAVPSAVPSTVPSGTPSVTTQPIAINGARSDYSAATLEYRPVGQRPNSDSSSITGPGSGNRTLPASPSPWKSLLVLLVVLALIVSATLFLRRSSFFAQRRSSHAGVRILARSSISPKQSLCLVKLGETILLLGLSPNHMAMLHTVEDPDEIAGLLGTLEQHKHDSITNSFSRMFRHEANSYDDVEPANDYEGVIGDRDGQWSRARGELTSLLDKVKGLARMKSRP